MLTNLANDEELRISYIIGDKIQKEIIHNCVFEVLPNGDIYVRHQAKTWEGKTMMKECTYRNRFILAVGATRKLDSIKEELFDEN